MYARVCICTYMYACMCMHTCICNVSYVRIVIETISYYSVCVYLFAIKYVDQLCHIQTQKQTNLTTHTYRGVVGTVIHPLEGSTVLYYVKASLRTAVLTSLETTMINTARYQTARCSHK